MMRVMMMMMMMMMKGLVQEELEKRSGHESDHIHGLW